MVNKIHQKVKTVLENVYEKHFLGVENPPIGIHYNFTELLYSDDDVFDGSENINDILDHLVDKQIIKDYDLNYKEACFIDFPTDFRVIARKYIKELSGEESAPVDLGSAFVLYLDNNGNLWHGEDKTKFCYPMIANSKRFKIVEYLVDNKGFQSPSEMINHVGSKNTKTIRSEINNIRNMITELLCIDGKELIDYKKGSGYRINPKYQVFIKKNS